MDPDAAQQVFSLIGQVVAAGGGGALVAFAIFRSLGKGWIENQLAKDLEAAKSEIALLSARQLKLHDREYAVFPEIWAKLQKAVASLGGAIISFREIPDFNRQSEVEQDEWLTRSDLSEDEKRYFLAQADKVRTYSRILDWRDLVRAREDFIEFRTFFHANRIFIRPEIKEKFDQIDNLLNSSWVSKKMDWDGYSRGGETNFLSEALKKYEREIKPLMAEIEGLVQGTFFPR